MKKLIIFLTMLLLIAFGYASIFKYENKTEPITEIGSSQTFNEDKSGEKDKIFSWPLDRAEERITKKPFGLFVTPINSPVKPEKFSGYHTGVDFEIFSSETDQLVSVRAVCSGEVVYKNFVNGYGGVLITTCEEYSEPITILYGHLKLSSIKIVVGEKVKRGDIVAELGNNYSKETDGERKHLHLAFHRGKDLDFRGYVRNKNNLKGWIDPLSLLKN